MPDATDVADAISRSADDQAPGALVGEPSRQGGADSAAPAGDDDYPIGDVQKGALSSKEAPPFTAGASPLAIGSNCSP